MILLDIMLRKKIDELYEKKLITPCVEQDVFLEKYRIRKDETFVIENAIQYGKKGFVKVKVFKNSKEVICQLGLSMTALFMEKYGCRISVASVFGEGSIFTLYFPLYENENIR